MLVSSYNTYINTASTQRTQNERNDGSKKVAKSFVLKPTQLVNKNISPSSSLPIDYIPKYKVLNNKQVVQQQELANNPAKMKFTKISSIASAQVAYSENSKMFSLLAKPKPTINQMPRIDQELPKEAQKGQESIMKSIMVNTYIDNDNYYKITA